jgi:cytochrome P450
VSHATIRYTAAAVDVGGRPLRKGRLVLVSLGAANRDGDTFPGADAFDIGRTPARHLAFGHGPHFCLGAPLARAQMRVAIGELLRRFPRLRLAAGPGPLRRRPSTFLRGLSALPVRVD